MTLTRGALCYLILIGSMAQATVTSPDFVSEELAKAPLVAQVRILSVESISDPVFHALFVAAARVLRIDRAVPDGGSFPTVGETIAITGPGGEIDDVGVMLSGLARPHAGATYVAYLKRWDSSRFTIAGLEAGLVSETSARAFSRNRTDGSNGEGNGPFLFWDDQYFPLPYYLSAPTFQNLPKFAAAVDESFRSWRNPEDIKVEFLSMGCTTNTRNENDGVNSIILITKDWPFDANAIAITRNFYVAGSSSKAGLILDSDILLNGVNHKFTTTNEAGHHDVQNILTHEVGHFLGLGHETGNPPNSDAVMFAVASPNETKKRDLHANDLAGIRSAYLGLGKKIAFTPSACVLSSENSGCMAVHSGGAGGGTAFAVLFLLLLVGMGRLRVIRNP